MADQLGRKKDVAREDLEVLTGLAYFEGRAFKPLRFPGVFEKLESARQSDQTARRRGRR
jgi:hypothetical protein